MYFGSDYKLLKNSLVNNINDGQANETGDPNIFSSLPLVQELAHKLKHIFRDKNSKLLEEILLAFHIFILRLKHPLTINVSLTRHTVSIVLIVKEFT